MTAPVCDQVADHRMPDQRQVANHVQDLVADELVLEPERVVQNPGFPEDDGVVERAAKGQAALPEHLDLFQEAERPGWSNLFDEAVLGDSHRPRLMTQQRMVEADAVSDLEVIRGIERDSLVSVGQRDRPHHLQEPAGG